MGSRHGMVFDDRVDLLGLCARGLFSIITNLEWLTKGPNPYTLTGSSLSTSRRDHPKVQDIPIVYSHDNHTTHVRLGGILEMIAVNTKT